MTPTDLANLTFWVGLVSGTAAALGLLAWALNTLEDRIQQALQDEPPFVDDVTERRRLHAIVEWKR